MPIKQLRALLMRDACVQYPRLKAESNHFLFSPEPQTRSILRTRATGTAGAGNANRINTDLEHVSRNALHAPDVAVHWFRYRAKSFFFFSFPFQ